VLYSGSSHGLSFPPSDGYARAHVRPQLHPKHSWSPPGFGGVALMSPDPQGNPASPSTAIKPPKLREVRLEDYPQIAALAAKFDLHTESYPAWTHLWTNNPACRLPQNKLPMGWVLDIGDGLIGGYLGNIPMAYELEGQRFLAATTRAWVVDTPYRSFSPLLLATYFQQRNVDIFMSTTVNSLSEPAYSSFQSTRMPVGAWDRTLFWITNYRGFVASYLRKSSRAIAAPLSYPLSAGLFVRDRVMQSRLPKNSRDISVLPCASFDDRFQTFWEKLRAVKSRVLISDRSRDALDWHFKYALEQDQAWIYTIEGKSGLVAYAVFLRYDFPQVGLTRVRLADFQCIEPEKSLHLLTAMLATAVERCRRESIHMFELVGLTPALEKKLEAAVPHRRVLGSWLSYYRANNPKLAQILKDSSAWEPSLFDGDSSL
jgi:hypothetical protein